MEFRKTETKRVQASADVQQKMLSWPDCYYRERDAKIRMALLEEAERQGLTPEENPYRRKLFEIRYPKFGKASAAETDEFIKLWVEMRFLYENSSGFFGRGPNQAKLRKALDAIGYFDAQSKIEKDLMGRELYHMTMLYMSLCQEDKQYSALILGIGKMSDDAVIAKIGKEVQRIGIKVPELYRMTEECALFTQSVRLAWEEMFPDYAGYIDE